MHEAQRRESRASGRTGAHSALRTASVKRAISLSFMEPLGSFSPLAPAPLTIASGAFAILTATALMELSRTLAETYKGRWFAGNGRDIFHVGAAGVIASALFVSGLPPAFAALAAATAAILPLLLVDRLPSARPRRVAFLLALFALATAPVLLAPRAAVGAGNAMARALFPRAVSAPSDPRFR